MTTKTVWRYDAGGKVRTRRTPEGFLITEGSIAQPGIMLYEDADGNVTRELVDEDVLNDPKANATLYGKALVVEHPDADVTPDNWRELAHGTAGDWSYEDALWVGLNVYTRDALDAIAAGKVQLSPGYAVRVDDTPGTHPKFGPYDTRQLPGRQYNHVALTDEARGGPNLTIRRDSARQVTRDDTMTTKPTKPTTQPKTKPTVRRDADGAPVDETTTQQDATGGDVYDPRADMQALNQKFDKMIGLLEKVLGGGDDSEVDDKVDADGEPMPDDKVDADGEPPAPKQDSAAPGRLLAERRKIDEVAARYGIDVSTDDLLDASNDKVKRYIIKQVRPTFKRYDSADAVAVMFDELSSAPTADAMYSGNDFAAPSLRGMATKHDAATGSTPAASEVKDMRRAYGVRGKA
jgi:hypothetical protein